MSETRDDAIEMRSIHGVHLDVEDILKKLSDIQIEFISLQNKIQFNLRLQQEHRDVLQGRKHDVSNDYVYQVMSNFSYLYLSYEDIKRKLTHYLSAAEIKEIEDSVINAAEDDRAFANLMFFPQYQAMHTASVSQHAQALNQAKYYNDQDVWIKNTNYSERVKTYRTWYLYTGLLSIIGIGIPFLLGGLVTHIIDKLSVALSSASLRKNNQQIDRQIEANTNPKLSALEAKVNIDTESVLRQGFFSLAKQRFTREIREVDSNHNKLAN